MIRQIAMINGSPKGIRSTSYAVLSHLNDIIADEENHIEIYQAADIVKGKTNISAIYDVDVIIFSSPLYIDALTYDMIQLMEMIKESKASFKEGIAFIGIINSGFPEKEHTEIAQKMMRNFALGMDFSARGMLSLGGGGIIAGRNLESLKKQAKNQRKALEIVAQDIRDKQYVSQKAIDLFNKLPVTHKGLIKTIDKVWLQVAQKNNVKDQLGATPYK